MKTIVVSDLHLGSRHCHAAEFLDFLAGLPRDATLVLNGDTIDRRNKKLPPEHETVLAALRALSLRQPVIWIPGNHDDTYRMPDPAGIQFVPTHAIEHRLFITHGHDFDNVMPYHRAFLLLFRCLHHLRVTLGAESVHVAYYAKKFAFLYEYLCRTVRLNAVEHARENGFAAVTCGHTHFIEDSIFEGVRYLNTGSWTERPLVYLLITEDQIGLVPVSGAEV
ncbi:MAG: UDP-2,3-diacylglucosamine diphosphatase [Verrucomicrobia bacterium]|nr:UDP-2,3-diacylglucosamine diphosphatase [Verrucomicrobiota bacterium]